MLDDFQPAPNITARPDLYELENRALDPDGLVLAAMRTLAPWQGKTLVDLGCGTGYWLPLYADEAATVVGVEPEMRLLRVLRPGGALVVVDNDQRHGEFADLLSAAANAAQGRAEVTDSWWADRGAERIEVMSSWQFAARADLEAVLRLEFPRPIADRWLARNPGRSDLTYGYVLFAVRTR